VPGLPAHLAEKILTSRSAMAGERKQVTVLFADLKGSQELVGAEKIHVLLDPRRGEQRQRLDDLTEERRRAERRREQLDQDLRDWGFAVAPRRHG